MKYNKPKREHKDNLKIELASSLSKSSIFMHLEYKHKNCRFDGVIVRNNKILAIIEIKNWSESRALTRSKKPSDQLNKYLKFGVPVYVLWTFNGTKGLVKRLKKLVSNFDQRGKLAKPCLSFFPQPSELEELIIKQKRDMKHSDRIWGHQTK